MLHSNQMPRKRFQPFLKKAEQNSAYRSEAKSNCSEFPTSEAGGILLFRAPPVEESEEDEEEGEEESDEARLSCVHQ